MRGKLIVLTGIDGSGKTVQTRMLYERLVKEGYLVETMDYPRYGETLFGELVGRFETRDRIEGWLADGKIVLANRYVADDIAHQGVRVGGSDLEMEKFTQWLARLEYEVFKMPMADINILLSLPLAIAHKLVAQKKAREYLGDRKRDIHEDDLAYLIATSKYFHKLALQPDWRIVGCADSHDNLLGEAFISERIWDCVAEFLKIGNTDIKSAPTFAPGTMAALRVIDNWDGQKNRNYVLAEWCEHEGEMQWCHWPHGGRVIDYTGDEILDIWIMGKNEAITRESSANLNSTF